MLKKFRDIVPFIFLLINFLTAIASYFETEYKIAFKYLGDVFGYSILSCLFMLSVYSNRKYCNTTRVVVYGLIALNFFNLIWLFLGVNGIVYDIFIMIIILLTLTYYKYKL